MLSADAILALGSAIPLLALGALLLAPRPRTRDAVFFGLFAMLWGAQVVLGNLGRVTESPPTLYAAFLLASFAASMPAWVFLAHVAATRLSPRAAGALRGVALAWAIVGAAWLLARPTDFVAAVAPSAGAEATLTFGPAMLPLFLLPFNGIAFTALLAFYVGYRRAAPGSARQRARRLVLAFALFPSYAAVRYAILFLDADAVRVQGASALATPAVYAAGALLVLGIAAHAALRPPTLQGRDATLLAALLAPAAIALAEASLAPDVRSFGFWRFATVAVLAHAIARDRLFDLDILLKRAAGPVIALLALGYAALAALAFALRAPGTQLPLVVVLAGVLCAGGAFAARDALGRRLFPTASVDDDYLAARRLEVYRAALEQGAGDDALRKLRRELGISEREHDVMAFMARPRPRASPFAPGSRIAERYRIDRSLGEGAHGRALLAADEAQGGAPVVLKVVGLSGRGAEAASALLREAKLMRRIAHPHVLRVLDVVEEPESAILVLEHAAGGTLEGLAQRRGALPLAEATRILREVLEALDAAHEAGVVHRDVKPDNVLLDARGSVKVADFGVARDARPDATVAMAPAAGTLLYMAPEQVRGEAADARADLYAAAALFHRILTGRHYLRIAGRDDFQVRRAILEEEPQLDARGAPAWVEPFLLRALAKAPRDRFASAREMLAALPGPSEPLMTAPPSAAT